jgi:AcrR family transcriptional regulator
VTLATYDMIVTLATERISRAYREPGGWRERLQAGFGYFAEIIVTEREASHLVLVDALGAGHPVLEHHDRMIGIFELMFRQSFRDAPAKAIVTDTTIRAIVSGIRRVAYRRLLRDEPEKLDEVVADLLDWAVGYHTAGARPPLRPSIVMNEDSPHLQQALRESAIAPLDPALASATHTHRERILHAVVSLASEGGYQALSIPAISQRAGISNEAFYEHFADKQDAFLTVFRETSGHALTPALEAFQTASCWPQAAHDSIAALLQFIAGDPVFARLAFFEILTGGRAAIELPSRVSRHSAACCSRLTKNIPSPARRERGDRRWTLKRHAVRDRTRSRSSTARADRGTDLHHADAVPRRRAGRIVHIASLKAPRRTKVHADGLPTAEGSQLLVTPPPHRPFR